MTVTMMLYHALIFLVSINCVDSPQKPDVKSRLEEEHKSHGNGEKSQHEVHEY